WQSQSRGDGRNTSVRRLTATNLSVVAADNWADKSALQGLNLLHIASHNAARHAQQPILYFHKLYQHLVLCPYLLTYQRRKFPLCSPSIYQYVEGGASGYPLLMRTMPRCS